MDPLLSFRPKGEARSGETCSDIQISRLALLARHDYLGRTALPTGVSIQLNILMGLIADNRLIYYRTTQTAHSFRILYISS